MVLLIVAIVAGLSIKFSSDYQYGLARAEARWHGTQARAYLLSGEEAAIKFLTIYPPEMESNYIGEVWSNPVPLELPDNMGNLNLKMEDANSQFNLNSLASGVLGAPPGPGGGQGGGTPLNPGPLGQLPLPGKGLNQVGNVVANVSKGGSDPASYTPSQRMFIRLLQVLPNPEDQNRPLLHGLEEATGIMEAIIDWTDPDQNQTGVYGAEDDYYLSQPDPYQAANMPFRSIEELQMVRGVTPAIMKAVRPYITVLDPAERLNVNTMNEIFYRCVNDKSTLNPLDESQAKSLQQSVPTVGHFTNQADFDNALNRVLGANADKEMTVKTSLFWLNTAVQIGDQRRIGRSLMQRGTPFFKVLRREDGA